MTYKDLLDYLQTLTIDQLSKNVLVDIEDDFVLAKGIGEVSSDDGKYDNHLFLEI